MGTSEGWQFESVGGVGQGLGEASQDISKTGAFTLGTMGVIDGFSLMAQNLPAMQETCVPSVGQEDLLEKEMAAHSGILAGEIPRMEEPGRLWSMKLQRSGT